MQKGKRNDWHDVWMEGSTYLRRTDVESLEGKWVKVSSTLVHCRLNTWKASHRLVNLVQRYFLVLRSVSFYSLLHPCSTQRFLLCVLILSRETWTQGIASPTRERLLLTSVFDLLLLYPPPGPLPQRLSEHNLSLQKAIPMQSSSWSWEQLDGGCCFQMVTPPHRVRARIAWFSCSDRSLRQPGWQGSGGGPAQHFSYCYVSVLGLWTACGGQSKDWVPPGTVCVVSIFTSLLKSSLMLTMGCLFMC